MNQNTIEHLSDSESVWNFHDNNLNAKEVKPTSENDDSGELKFSAGLLFQNNVQVDFLEESEQMPLEFYENVQEPESQEFFMKKQISFLQMPASQPQGEKIEAMESEKVEEMKKPLSQTYQCSSERQNKSQQLIQINQKEASKIFTLNRGLKRMKKNTNVPKFLVRIFMKHASKILAEGDSDLAYQFHKEMEKALVSKNANNYKISDLLEVMGDAKPVIGLCNRKVIHEILTTKLKEEVIKNGYIDSQHKKSYMIASKVYNIRCRNLTLASRVQIH